MQNSPDAQGAAGGKIRDIKGSTEAGSHWTEDAAQFRKKLSTLEGDLKELTKIGRSLASDTLGILKQGADEYYHQGLDKAKSIEKNLEGKVRNNPVVSLLIALGLGFLVGLILRRR